MKRMNIQPAYKYKIKDMLISTIIFYAIMVLILAALITGTLHFTVNVGGNFRSSFTGFGFAAAIFLFISGIVAIREDLRLFMQNGIGRKTTFVIQILIAGTVSLTLALLGELLLKVSQLIAGPTSNLIISDLYYMIFVSFNAARHILIQHLESVVTNLVMFTSAYTVGVFISLLFYRLNKFWTILVAVGAPIFIFVGIPILISRYNFLGKPVLLITSHPWLYIAFFIAITIVTSLLNWLLLRRAPVKAAAV